MTMVEQRATVTVTSKFPACATATATVEITVQGDVVTEIPETEEGWRIFLP